MFSPEPPWRAWQPLWVLASQAWPQLEPPWPAPELLSLWESVPPLTAWRQALKQARASQLKQVRRVWPEQELLGHWVSGRLLRASGCTQE